MDTVLKVLILFMVGYGFGEVMQARRELEKIRALLELLAGHRRRWP